MFISLSPFDQIVALLSTFDGVIVDEKDNQIIMRVIIFTLYRML